MSADVYTIPNNISVSRFAAVLLGLLILKQPLEGFFIEHF